MAEKPNIVELRPMGIGDILDATFRLYRHRAAAFATIAIIAYLPYLVYETAIAFAFLPSDATLAQVQPDPNEPGGAAEDQGDAVAYLALQGLGTGIFLLIVLPLAQAALIYNISTSVLGERATAMESYGRGMRRVLPLVGTNILVGLVVMLGFFLLIVPGVIFSLWFCIVAPIVVLEAKAGTGAMGRSRELVKGNLRKALGLVAVIWLLGFAIGMAGGLIAMMLPVHYAVQNAIINIFQAIILPIQLAPLILFYYELRVRKEAFDLQRLEEALPVADRTTPTSSSGPGMSA